jgi:hypothetical protein
MSDLSNAPLILAGPVIRRVEPTAVSIWIALSEPRTVEVGLWVGATAAPGGFFGNGTAAHRSSAQSLRIGAKLHLAMVTVDLSGSPLIPGQLYAYNVVLSGGAADADLSSERLLEDKGPATEPTQLALGYVPGLLPSFALPPIELDRLQLVQGSCRKAHGLGQDGMAALDMMIARTRDDPLARPHQLFLTGDQIYADDVAMMLLPLLTETGNALIGVTERLPLSTSPVPVEATAANFPTTWRQELVVQQARFTSSDASSHLLSFGEFCALYLFSWSNVLWSDLPAKDKVFPENEDDSADVIVAGLPGHLQGLYPSDKRRKKRIDARNGLRGAYQQQLDDLGVFRKALPRVQRALANVPTYMIFDDHEVTDDWYLTQDWRDKVLTAPLGVTVVRNSLLSYTLFQGWGNDPARFTSGDHARLLTLATQLFSGGAPAPAVANELGPLLGLDGSVPAIRWDYTVPTGPTTTAVLDTRTRRSFVGRLNPPGLLTAAALDEQLPISLVPSPGAVALIVVSPAPVLGLALVEELLQPLAARGYSDFYVSVVKEGEPAITGYLEWDMEAWALDTARFEALLARCFEMGRTVLLSGDVHYAFSAEMDYWKQGQPNPARIVQLTASALKNEWGEKPKRALETVAVQQLLHSAFYPAVRLGWDDPLDLVGRVNVPGGAVPRQLRALLRRTPTVLPVEGWPAGTAISIDPEWAWRMSLVKDVRADGTAAGSRPADGQIGSISPDVNPGDPENGYVAVVKRGEAQLKAKIARAVVYASQLGLVTFPNAGAAVRHSLMYVHPTGQKPADPQAYTLHEMSLTPTSDPVPTVG